MKILSVSDAVVQRFYDYYTPGVLDEYDLIIACGDLKPAYLEFLVTMAHCPLLYVHGNHDERYETDPPGGCDCIEDQIFVHNGVRILGLGGSYRYRKGPHMYTEKEMRRRVRKLWFQLWKHKGFDILIAHAPARGVNDFDTLPHRGFECFNTLIEKYKPKYFIHGHIHRNYGVEIPQITQLEHTTVINAYEYCVIDYQ